MPKRKIKRTAISQFPVPIEPIERRIFLIRGEKVTLDADLAELYQVRTKVFNQAVKRNPDRFPEDFMFQLTNEEFENLRSQVVTSSWGGRRYLPYAFNEHGVAMLCSVLNSQRAGKTLCGGVSQQGSEPPAVGRRRSHRQAFRGRDRFGTRAQTSRGISDPG